MSLNQTASADRIHIGFFGLRNAGKSSVVNAVTGQELAVVSDVKGTTTDPVKKAMELLPLGPVVVIDTPGIDDEGSLGELRVKKAKQVLNYADIAVLVVDLQLGLSEADEQLKALFAKKEIPYIIAFNKSDLSQNVPEETDNTLCVSAKTGLNINRLKDKMASLLNTRQNSRRIAADLVNPGDTVLLVVPIDKAAPKGRLILPQQQTIRDLLDSGAMAFVTRDSELEECLASLKNPPALVITDSQAFGRVSKIVPHEIPLTSFSILFVRYKGDLEAAVNGAAAIDKLNDGDTVLISEGCTHHRQCDDIGTVKLPNWIRAYTKKEINFEFTSGGQFPEDVSKYALVIHCGGCMLGDREMKYRSRSCIDAGVPITNYGTAIAHINGILARSIEPLKMAKNDSV